jgi:4-hydroxybenzoate polyprenyltransferase
VSILPYLKIARFDHWGKNLFMILGCVLAWFMDAPQLTSTLILTVVLGFLLTGFVASSNYVINEVLDADKDRHHPDKQNRPIPSGQVKIPIAYGQWILMGLLGIVPGFFINSAFGLSALALWIMGCAYNIPPVRTKELPYLDVVSESVNNPLRLLLGWFIVIPNRIPPVSLLVAYWMFGAFFMALKRYAEYRHIGDKTRASDYRSSFKWYNEDRLMISCFFYMMLGSLFAGVFIVRYQVELVLFLPFAAAYMSYYLKMGFRENSPVQHPEKLFREKHFMVATVICGVVFVLLMLVEIPQLYDLFNVPQKRLPALWRF